MLVEFTGSNSRPIFINPDKVVAIQGVEEKDFVMHGLDGGRPYTKIDVDPNSHTPYIVVGSLRETLVTLEPGQA